MLFSEETSEWKQIPEWVTFLLRLGFGWPSELSARRRIALVSMPCDSAAAGLIALGAFIRDLGIEGTNDVGQHFDSLLRYAQQYLGRCCDCTVRCKPELQGCGYVSEATGRIRSTAKPPKRYFVEGFSLVDDRHIKFRNGGTIKLYSAGATNYYIDGDPPPIIRNESGALSSEVYAQIVENANIRRENIGKSYSGLCYAGRIAGESASRAICASIRLKVQNVEYRLSDLLTIHGWSSSTSISRANFYNTRTERFDREASVPTLVVADGDEGFLKILSHPRFQRSDVIGVIHKAVDRERLEAVGTRLEGLRQWYVDDLETFGENSRPPKGIQLLVLAKRGA